MSLDEQKDNGLNPDWDEEKVNRLIEVAKANVQ